MSDLKVHFLLDKFRLIVKMHNSMELSPREEAMKFRQKLERLTRFANKRKMSIAAGLGANTLYGLVSDGNDASLSTVTAIAKVLGVDVGWLVDDSRGWPPVHASDPCPEPKAA